MSRARVSARLSLAAVILVGALVAGQSVTDAHTPTGIVTGTGATVGRAAFSYLAGLRAFAAYELWNRIDPIGHEYYAGVTLDRSYYLIPTVRIVMLLKPDFAPPYYILPWMLAKNGKMSAAKSLAQEGVANNPKSGLLLMSYAQILALEFGDWAGALPYADRATRADTYWADDVEQWQSLRIAEDIYSRAGETEKVKAVAGVLDAISAKTGGTPPADALGQNHDHNGDGVPDH